MSIETVTGGTWTRLTLSPEGVRFGGHVFHDQAITSQLFASMLPKVGRSNGGRACFYQAKVRIWAIVYRQDCSRITVIDTGRCLCVSLPNAKPTFAEGLSYSDVKAIKATDRALNQQWISEDELVRAKDKYLQLKNGSMPP